ncbi:DUF3775 domain-containing protein [Litorisediminicola beolgyonensis]|uniref:DUF3775 domain-containing protein n=1 Tax=Litorisediminicola beolgyonensis TaxID=1173614 RepID=A0ABW3ZDI1_9RHOB
MDEINITQVAQVILMAHELGRAEPELRGFIEGMSQDDQAALVAIMWIGRGSFDAEDWDEALATAREEATTPTADYLIGTPHVADHLEAGAEALGLPIADAEEDIL